MASLASIIGAAISTLERLSDEENPTLVETEKARATSITEAANSVQTQSPAETTNIRCRYCDGVFIPWEDLIKCPFCRAPIQNLDKRIPRNANTQKNESEIKAESKMKSGYYVNCYNCLSTVRYAKGDIYHNPGANRIVKSKGFTGHTGEVKCPKCGVFLPHFESNWKQF